MIKDKITAIIIEKDQKQLNHLIFYLNKVEEISVVGTAFSSSQGMTLVQNYMPNLLFINVDLDDLNGLEVAHRIREQQIFSELIFTAGNSCMAYNTLKLQPLDFWVSPIDDDTVNQMLKRLKEKIKKKELMRRMDLYVDSQKASIKKIFKRKKGIIILSPHEIVFLKTERSSIVVTLNNRDKVKLKSGLNETLEILNSEDFIKVSRSFCVNCRYLRKVDKRNLKYVLHFEGTNWEVPVSKNTMKQIEKLNVYPIY